MIEKILHIVLEILKYMGYLYLIGYTLFIIATWIILPKTKHTFSWPVIRWQLLAFVFGIMYFLGIVLWPINYPLRGIIRKKQTPFLWWFFNNDEKFPEGHPQEGEFDLISNTYGDQKWRNKNNIVIDNLNWFRKSIVNFRWTVIRNPHYVLKLLVAPKLGRYENLNSIINDTVPEQVLGLVFCNYDRYGEQYIFFDTGGARYFRYSFTREVWFFGKKLRNLQFGSSEVRFIYKNKYQKINTGLGKGNADLEIKIKYKTI